MSNETQYCAWLEEMTIHDIPQVGGKNASLGEMIRELGNQGVNVPGGFCTTAAAYRHYIAVNGLKSKLQAILSDLDVNDVDNLRERGKQARDLILKNPIPKDLENLIIDKYQQMCVRFGQGGKEVPSIDVAVRSSATAEDLPNASFAGQQETYLNVHGVESLIDCCLKCYASLFTDRAINYRTLNGFDHFDVALSIGVQKMVRSDKAAAGVIFTINTENGFNNTCLVTGSYGLGEMVVQGNT
jgi:pyruvate,water dikinase